MTSSKRLIVVAMFFSAAMVTGWSATACADVSLAIERMFAFDTVFVGADNRSEDTGERNTILLIGHPALSAPRFALDYVGDGVTIGGVLSATNVDDVENSEALLLGLRMGGELQFDWISLNPRAGITTLTVDTGSSDEEYGAFTVEAVTTFKLAEPFRLLVAWSYDHLLGSADSIASLHSTAGVWFGLAARL